MTARKITLCMIFLTLLITYTLPPAWAGPQVTAKSALLINVQSGTIVYGKNEKEPLPPASTTKILTALIALDKTKLTDIVTAGENPSLVEPSAIGLTEGESISMENLLYSLLLKSANDAAVAIAEHVSGSVPEFADLMNRTARELGAVNSNFVNPNGLPDPNHYSTAYDLALIARRAMENPEFRQIVSTKVKVIPRQDDSAIKWLENHNKLLWRYDGANGIKTGYTRQARQCLVASASKDGQEFIAVILGAEGTNVWLDAKNLLDYGFSNFATYQQRSAGSPVTTVGVKKGEKSVTLVTQKDFFYTLPRSQKGTITEEIITENDITGPVKKGQVLGQIKFNLDGKKIGSVDLIAGEDIPARKITFKGAAASLNPLVAGAVIIGAFVALTARRRRQRLRRKSGRIWINRNLIR